MTLKGIWSQNKVFFRILTASLAISIIGSWSITNWLAKNSTHINLSLEGLSTCFSRVSQNYSGKMIGGNQAYTSPDFYQMTEQCFSDLERVIKKSYFLKNSNEVQSLFSNFIKKSYWFHRFEITENEFIKDNTAGGSSLTLRFKEIENLNENLISLTSNIRNGVDERKDLIFYLGGISVLALTILMLAFNFSGDNEDKKSVKMPIHLNKEDQILTSSKVSTGISQIEKIGVVQPKIDIGNGPEKFDTFFNRFLRLIGPRLIRRGANFNFSVEENIPRIIYPDKVQRELELFFERTMNFNHSSLRACQVECYQVNADKTEIRFYDSGICLYKSMRYFKNVKSDNGLIIGVEYRHRFSIKKARGKLKSLFRGTKKELQRELRS